MKRTKNLVLMALFAALIAAGAFLKIPIPFVPFTLQLLATTMAGILLGPKYGTLSVFTYIAVGLAGIPVFAGGGGIAYIFQPTFGYLLGFLMGTFVTGKIANKVSHPTMKRLLAANFAGMLIIYAAGTAYFWMISTFYTGIGIGLWSLFLYCFFMTAPGDVVLCIAAAYLGRRLLPVIHREDI